MPNYLNQLFILCTEKKKLFLDQWMEKFWKSDAKYAKHGVDGSPCSFLKYLSEVSGIK